MTLFSDPMVPEEHDIVAAQARIAELEALLRRCKGLMEDSSVQFGLYERRYSRWWRGGAAFIAKFWKDRLENNAETIEMVLNKNVQPTE